MRIRYYDRSGELVRGHFFLLEVPLDTQLAVRTNSDSALWTVSDTGTMIYESEAYLQTTVESDPVYGCRLDPKHVTDYVNMRLEWVQLRGFSQLCEFVRAFLDEFVFTTADFARRLVESSLTGLATFDVQIDENLSLLHDPPPLRRLGFQGRNCTRQMRFRVPEPNECPRCQRGPIVCPACQYVEYVCPACKLELVGWTNEPHDRPFTAEIVDDSDYIVEAHEWDGSDFIKGKLITGRALQFLLDAHATPFIAKPCWTNVERLSNEQRRALDAM